MGVEVAMRTSLAAVTFLCLRYVPGASTAVAVLGVWPIATAAAVVVTARRTHERMSEHFDAGRVAHPFLLVLGLAVTVTGLTAVILVAGP
ncbi:DUF202 domain-containing protein [Rhodococcus daqingensis]|uniref:DUF202 domain-containing protein n=1 Tax=Rhodococcus daqingensis TaxID=2479363 RepID=A0ABW2RRV4_9NOCA